MINIDAAKLQNDLVRLYLSPIHICDDTQANIYAAMKLVKLLPNIKFFFHSCGQDMIDMIPENHMNIRLILTDREMEAPNTGIDVAVMGWTFHIPTFVCSGGFQHNNQNRIRVYPDKIYLPNGSEKNSIDTWQTILRQVIDQVEASNTLVAALLSLRASESVRKEPDHFTGEMIGNILNSLFGNT